MRKARPLSLVQERELSGFLQVSFHTLEPGYYTHLNAIIVPNIYALFPSFVDLQHFVPGVLASASTTLGIGFALARAFDMEERAFDHLGFRIEDSDPCQKGVTVQVIVSLND